MARKRTKVFAAPAPEKKASVQKFSASRRPGLTFTRDGQVVSKGEEAPVEAEQPALKVIDGAKVQGLSLVEAEAKASKLVVKSEPLQAAEVFEEADPLSLHKADAEPVIEEAAEEALVEEDIQEQEPVEAAPLEEVSKEALVEEVQEEDLIEEGPAEVGESSEEDAEEGDAEDSDEDGELLPVDKQKFDGSSYGFADGSSEKAPDFRLDFQSRDCSLTRRKLTKLKKEKEKKRESRITSEFLDKQFSEEEVSEQELFEFIAKMSIPDAEGSNTKKTVFEVDDAGLLKVGNPEELISKLSKVGYECLYYLAVQICLILNTPSGRIRSLMLEGPSGCGKSFMAKSLAKITGAEFMCVSCYPGMPTQNFIETPSTLALANAMAGKDNGENELMNLGILSRAFMKSQTGPVILLIDELDKPDDYIDTFFLGPIQDGKIWLESRDPVEANTDNLLIIFTKNFNRKIDDALVRRCHPVMMTYLDATLERKILSPHCLPQLVSNLVGIADRMRDSGGSYEFERPPAPEELLTIGHYVMKLMEWGIKDFAFVGKSVWNMVSKSTHDRAVLEHMLRFHPDFLDPLVPDSRYVPLEVVHAKLGRLVLNKVVADPEARKRKAALLAMQNGEID